MTNTRSISRRDFIKISGLTFASAAFSGCGSFLPKTQVQGGKTVQVVYQDFNDKWFIPMAEDQLQKFHDLHPEISVYYIPDPVNLVDQMPLDMQAGTASDVFQGCCAHFPTWAQKGYTLDLRPFVESDLNQTTITDWDPVQYHAFFTRDGRQFGLPKYHGALSLYYNKDLFDQYKVDYPDSSWNHEDYLHAMKLLTRDQNRDGKTDLWGSMVDVYWDRIQVHVNGWGGHFVDQADPSLCLMGEPEAIAALEWLRARMWDDRCMATLPDVDRMSTRQAFISEKVAMVEEGSWGLKDILSGAQFRVGIAPFPSGPVRKVTLATTDGFGIYAGTKNPEAAWELMKFLIGKDYGRAMARADLLQPARLSLVGDWITYIQEEFPQQTKELDLAAFAEGQIKGYSVVAEIFTNMGDAMRIAQDSWDQILTLGKQPAESMITASKQIQEAQKQAD